MRMIGKITREWAAVNAKRGLGYAALGVCLALSGAATAAASTFTINNGLGGSTPTTLVEAYSGNSPDNFFTPTSYGSQWGPNISNPGDPYSTTGATITWTGNTITFQFDTTFPANSTQPGVDTTYTKQPVYAADIFIKSTGGSAVPQYNQFDYAIALGFTQAADGGLSAGLYQVSSAKTSQDIWTSRTGFVYGGEYAPTSTCGTAGCTGGQLSPTVLTGGTQQSDITVGTTFGTGTMDVSVTATDAAGLAELNAIFGNGDFDIFWGTGDCSNAPIWGDVTLTNNNVPEPGSVGLLASALLGFAVFCRRRRLLTRL